jgi:hypothetical protein
LTLRVADLRYRYDDPAYLGLERRSPAGHGAHEMRALSQNVRLGERVLPRVHAILEQAVARLAVEVPVQGFVFASAEANAFCVSEDDGRRILVFLASSLIQLFDERELLFVFGHELGHAVLEHHLHPAVPPDGAPSPQRARVLELRRYAEFSADRAGWLASRDTDVTIGAMLKSASGLSAANLEVDVSAFLSQVDDLRTGGGDELILYATHPPLALRVRALLRAESALRGMLAGADHRAELAELDRMIQRDLDVAACGYDGRGAAERGRTAAFWRVAWVLCRDGEFSAADQELMTDAFGTDRVDALRRLLREATDMRAAVQRLEERMNTTRTEIAQAPSLVERVYEDCLERQRGRITGL